MDDESEDHVGDEVESTIVEVLEERRRTASVDSSRAPGWRPAVVGERPPIPNMPEPQRGRPGLPRSSSARGSKPRLLDAARRVQKLNSLKSTDPQDTQSVAEKTTGKLDWMTTASRIAAKQKTSRHRRVKSESIMGTGILMKDTAAETLFDSDVFASLMREEPTSYPRTTPVGSEGSQSPSKEEHMSERHTNTHDPELGYTTEESEVLPFLTRSRSSYGSSNVPLSSELVISRPKMTFRSRLLSTIFCLSGSLNRQRVLSRLFSFCAVSVLVAIPLVCTAFVLFYKLKNPGLDFLPGDGRLSWWCLFLARQALTFDLARKTQGFGIDHLALQRRWVVSVIGPLCTLWLIQARGWPFILSVWALYDCILLHGNNEFQKNWLFWTDLDIFSDANPGSELLQSDFYFRVLMAAMLAGALHAVKRTYVALYFGRRTFLDFKPKLEKILADLVLVTEIADLVTELEQAELDRDMEAGTRFDSQPSQSSVFSLGSSVPQKLKKREAKWAGVAFNQGNELQTVEDEDEDRVAEEEDVIGLPTPTLSQTNLPKFGDNESTEEESLLSDQNDDKFSDDENDDMTSSIAPGSTFSPSTTTLPNDASLATIKSLLEEWEEPLNKLDQNSDATISDMLKFRKALTYMDDDYPFSTEFGPAGTRDQCIASAHSMYSRLIEAMDSEACSFSVMEILALNEDGTTNQAKVQHMKRLFRPDRYDEVSNVAFIQSCDGVYKRLRFFRASVGNSSVLQRVLEGVIDAMFNFVLGLAILAILKINAWSLIVSFSTILVSFAFALGPSASRYIEGVLSIAFRRPYDLGDRILIENATTRPAHDASRQSWLVEDINLYGTVLRYAATNEVSTVPNGSIAQCRIVNLARSPNALVTVTLRFQLGVADAKLSCFRSALQKFVRSRPRTWLELLYFRCEKVDTADDYLEYEIRLRHTKSWQAGPRILQNRATLVKFCYETGKRLEMNYSGAVNKLKVFDGQRAKQDDDDDDAPGCSRQENSNLFIS
mmetsp:Transcript_21059/g.31242  ORF Transcript_21059/g.31242 Transcript_21059/m.31242 type:complete len:1002 (-) Transcript_21059:137-3142(-)